MYMVVSPAKKLHVTPQKSVVGQEPYFSKQIAELVQQMKRKSASELQKLMKISEKLGELNYERYQSFQLPLTSDNSQPSIFSFAGDTYVGLQAEDFSAEDIVFADQHLGILSGLYGLLRPTDWMQPYRLEMGTKLQTERGKDLYQFWGTIVADLVEKKVNQQPSKTLINLASNEYFSVLKPLRGRVQTITPVFKEKRDDKWKIISFSAKRARGTMARYCIRNRIQNPSEIKNFTEDGYQFLAELSTDTEWVFGR